MTDTDFDRAVALSVHLQDTRETMRRLYGKEYEAKISPFRDLIRRGMANVNCSPLQVPRLMAENAKRAGNEMDGRVLLMFIAASVDVAEETGGGRGQLEVR